MGDLLAFSNRLLSHDLLNGTDTALVITGKAATPAPFPAGVRYGYGFEDLIDRGTRILDTEVLPKAR